MDAIAVLNAGSSSIKFSLFAARGDELALVVARPDRRALHVAALRREGRRRRTRSARSRGARATQLGHDGALDHLVAFLRDAARASTG